MKTHISIRTTLLLVTAFGIECASSSIPHVAGNSLAGEKVEFPKDLNGPLTFFIIGFSQKSADQATEWGKAIDGLEPCHGRRLTWFQLPVIASAPGFVRPLIVRSMRTGLTPSLQRHFVPITDHEGDWKLVAGYQAADPQKDDAYVVVLDQKGQILARWHGLRKSSEKALQDVFEQYCR